LNFNTFFRCNSWRFIRCFCSFCRWKSIWSIPSFKYLLYKHD